MEVHGRTQGDGLYASWIWRHKHSNLFRFWELSLWNAWVCECGGESGFCLVLPIRVNSCESSLQCQLEPGLSGKGNNQQLTPSDNDPGLRGRRVHWVHPALPLEPWFEHFQWPLSIRMKTSHQLLIYPVAPKGQEKCLLSTELKQDANTALRLTPEEAPCFVALSTWMKRMGRSLWMLDDLCENTCLFPSSVIGKYKL